MSKPPNKIYALIVEDEPDLNAAYKTILTSAGMKVDTCFNGEEALRQVAVAQPDIILLDLRMPKMDGLEFLKRFSKDKAAENVKIIIASNYDEEKQIEEAFKLGADRYMLKSWTSPQELVKLVQETLA